jgi:ADP-heptose:LPS heptosyltransferase
VSADSILLLPLSKSQATVGWPHFRALADALDGRAVFAAGPGECATLAAIAGPHRCLPPLPVGQFAAVSTGVAAVVGNDSGLAHLAQAARRGAGRPPASVHVIFGSTSPAQTGPSGCTAHQRTAHQREALPCQPCYKKYCTHDAALPPCLDVSVSVLLDALR